MTERKIKAGLKHWHRWLGFGAAVFLLVVSVSGFLLQHPEWLGTGEAAPGALAVDPADPDRLLRGTRWGVEESTDGGTNWRELPMLAPPENVFRIHFQADDGGRVFALGNEALVTSADGGRVWEDIRFPPEVLALGVPLVDVAATGRTWRVLAEDGVLVSADAGLTWSRVDGEAPGAGRAWHSWVHDLHTGHIFGAMGRRIAEFSALAVIFLTLSGLVMMTRRNGRRPR